MKRILLILIILLSASTCYATGKWNNTTITKFDGVTVTKVCNGLVTVGASCSTEIYNSATGTQAAAYGNDVIYMQAQSFLTPADAPCVCSVTVPIYKTGSPAGSMTVELWSSSSNAPNVKLSGADGGGCTGDTAGTCTATNLTTSAVDHTFTWSTCQSLSANTIYFVILKASQLNDSTNRFNFYYNSSGGADSCGSGVACREYKYTTSWTANDASADLRGVVKK